jgi:hypothetical protein
MFRAVSWRTRNDNRGEWAPGGRTPANWSRAAGQPVEAKLRAMEHIRPWWLDPALPLGEIQDGLPRWDSSGRREDSPDETAAEFQQIVQDYMREIEAGTVFPPLLVTEVTPAADRAALGPLRYWWIQRRQPPAAERDHYRIVNGRHRALAAWLLGKRTHPAYCWVSWAGMDFPELRFAEARRWWQTAIRLEAGVLEAAGANRGRDVSRAQRAAVRA